MSTEATSLSKKKEFVLKHENKIVLLWSLTVWMVVMNTTMFNVALPTVSSDFFLTSADASWIVSGYSIAFAIATVTYSRLSDFIPIKRLLLIGLTLLGVASIIGLFAHQYSWLLVARALQALGAGAVPGLAMILASRYIPISRRGRAMSFIASAASLGFGLGPVIGGAITQYLGWNYLFVITGLIILLAPIFLKLLPNEEVKMVKFDFIGAVLTGISVTGLLLFLSTLSIYFFIGSLVSVIWLWKHINKIQIPFIQPSLMRNRSYVKLQFVAFTAFIIHFSSLFLMPMILSDVFNKGPAVIGLIIFPGAILSAIVAPLIGRMIDRFGNRPIIVLGHFFLLVASTLFAFFSSVTPYAIMITYMFMSIGFSALTSSTSNEVTRLLPRQEVGAGMGLVQLMQFFGGALGVALSGLLLVWQSDLLPAVSYRNIFLGFSVLLVFSLFLFTRGDKKGKEKE
ncbi:MFS transporter [Halalkalibacter alkalisediminis]|uniref:MFS transporter n=1 Tax=Halalkalibacter alkalisediminis TaxID=935616 RepID=A0ABV6NG35_9BACI|nr:MFS transporter [Halalkalibacter alkalisediminis]